MTLGELKYWPWDVLPEELRSPFHRDFIALFEAVHEAGHVAYADRSETLLGFGSRECRLAEFVLRSSKNRYWEPWLVDTGAAVHLGPLFGLEETRCIVVDGIQDVASLTTRWLDGLSLDAALSGLRLFDRTSDMRRRFCVEASTGSDGYTAPRCPSVRIVGLSMHECDTMGASMRQAGAVGYVCKGGSPEELVRPFAALLPFAWQANCGSVPFSIGPL